MNNEVIRMFIHAVLFVLGALCIPFIAGQSQPNQLNPIAKPQRQHSLQPPFKKGDAISWNINGAAVTMEDSVVLTNGKPHEIGTLWNQYASTMVDWEMKAELKISGGENGGGGFAFWYTDRPGLVGPVFGSTDYWNGLSILFDSHPKRVARSIKALRDDKSPETIQTFGDVPLSENAIRDKQLVSAIYNDGTQQIRGHEGPDGINAHSWCYVGYRNNKDTTSVLVRYVKNTLTLSLAVESDRFGNKNYRQCLEINDLPLGLDKYFGFTAMSSANVALADTIEVVSVETMDLTPSDANLEGVRKGYEEYVEHEHLKPTHMQMDASHFQHNSLGLLHQIQDTLNLMVQEQSFFFQKAGQLIRKGQGNTVPVQGQQAPGQQQLQADTNQLTQQVVSLRATLNGFKDFASTLDSQFLVTQITQAVDQGLQRSLIAIQKQIDKLSQNTGKGTSDLEGTVQRELSKISRSTQQMIANLGSQGSLSTGKETVSSLSSGVQLVLMTLSLTVGLLSGVVWHMMKMKKMGHLGNDPYKSL